MKFPKCETPSPSSSSESASDLPPLPLHPPSMHTLQGSPPSVPGAGSAPRALPTTAAAQCGTSALQPPEFRVGEENRKEAKVSLPGGCYLERRATGCNTYIYNCIHMIEHHRTLYLCAVQNDLVTLTLHALHAECSSLWSGA